MLAQTVADPRFWSIQFNRVYLEGSIVSSRLLTLYFDLRVSAITLPIDLLKSIMEALRRYELHCYLH